MSRPRTGQARAAAPPESAGRVSSGARIGAALGLAAGFAVFAIALPLREASYHFPGSGSYPLFESAAVRAALTWVLGAALGLTVGAAAGAAAARSLAAGRGERAATAALGVYVLALRGAWGYAGPLPAEPARAAAALPSLSLILPVAAAAAAIGLMWWLAGRRRPAGETTPWITAHAVFSLTAAILAAQAAYYASRAGAFCSGLLEVLTAPF